MTRTPDGLQAGFAQLDITPELGTQLAGAVGRHRPANDILDPLHARAVILQSGRRKICILALDVTIITEGCTEQIRRQALERCGLDPQAIMVHATQTHSAPAIGYFMLDDDFGKLPAELEWVRGAEREYSEFAVERAVEAMCRADASMQPAEIGIGSGIEGRMAHNRRAVQRDGTITMPGRDWPQPLGPTNILYIEGPMDPELGLVAVRGASGDMMGAIMNYTCHPVHVFPRPVVSADWPGAAAKELSQAYGDCVCMVLNGACGNINPWPPFDPDYANDHEHMGAVLAEGCRNIAETLQFTGDVKLDARIEQLQIPLREVLPERLQWAREIIEADPEPLWADDDHTVVDPDWMAAASVWSVELMRRRSTNLNYEIQVLRIGQTAIVGLPGEPFAELGLQIKLNSPAYPTYIAHCTSHYTGYIPTRQALERGGHEADTRYWAKLAPEAFDMILAGATEMLQEVFEW